MSFKNVLYITYDGLTDALGQSQILAYLKRLCILNNRITIISFEKKDLYQAEASKIKEITDASNLIWIPLIYTKKPPVLSTIYDINRGYRLCRDLHRKYAFQIVHCRGYIPAIIGRKLQKRFDLRFIFDMRGWWADEKMESGFWDNIIFRPVYRYFKRREKEFFQYCDYAVSLTHKGKEEIVKQKMAPADKVGVVPTCVDFEIFKPNDKAFKKEARQNLGILDEEKVFVYSGSLGGNYDPDTLINVFSLFRKIYPASFLLVLTKDVLTGDLKEKFSSAGIKRMAIYNAPFTKVTNYLRAADVGFIYYKMSFSTIGRSPTKMGEYWASGVPVIALKDIGDIESILEKYYNSGMTLSSSSDNWMKEIEGRRFIDAASLRNYALDYFHVDKGVAFYQSVYELLTHK